MWVGSGWMVERTLESSGWEESEDWSGLVRKGGKMEGSVQQPWVLDWARRRTSRVFLG
jgi:hypothetical protein